MKQFRIYRTDEETFAILYCRTPYILTLRVNLLSQMNPLAELLQCDSRLIRYAWDSRLVVDDFANKGVFAADASGFFSGAIGRNH
jgi:hypothetical protein